jgi:hypothetical protein
VPDGLQERSQMDANGRSARNSRGLVKGLAAGFCDEGIPKLAERLDKHLNCNADYLDKYTHVVPSRDIKIIFMNTVPICS